jgi:hypothetical protein
MLPSYFSLVRYVTARRKNQILLGNAKERQFWFMLHWLLCEMTWIVLCAILRTQKENCDGVVFARGGSKRAGGLQTDNTVWYSILKHECDRTI